MKQNTLYLYHLEVDFAGIVKETFYFKTQIKNHYKKVFTMERTDCTVKCKNERDCTFNSKCQTQAESTYHLDVLEAEREIEKSLEKAINRENTIGLTITKLALLGNEHAIAFTNWLKHDLCPETFSPHTMFCISI